jgi:hypothetical protein
MSFFLKSKFISNIQINEDTLDSSSMNKSIQTNSNTTTTNNTNNIYIEKKNYVLFSSNKKFLEDKNNNNNINENNNINKRNNSNNYLVQRKFSYQPNFNAFAPKCCPLENKNIPSKLVLNKNDDININIDNNNNCFSCPNSEDEMNSDLECFYDDEDGLKDIRKKLMFLKMNNNNMKKINSKFLIKKNRTLKKKFDIIDCENDKNEFYNNEEEEYKIDVNELYSENESENYSFENDLNDNNNNNENDLQLSKSSKSDVKRESLLILDILKKNSCEL